jgi:hypothetical protein
MKKLFLATILLALAIVVPVPATAAVDVSVGFPLPPPIVFPGPPEVIVMPDANDVYVAPNVSEDMYFSNGFWWRHWEGRWYRSPYYDRGWAYYNHVPGFYFDVDPGWRGYYRDRNWNGHPWNYERIPYDRFHQNWKSWHNNHYWEKHGAWGVQGYRPRSQQQRQEIRHQRQVQYNKRPEVQRHQQQLHEKQKQQQHVKQKQQPHEKQKQQQHEKQIQQPHDGQKPQGKQHEEESEHRK